MVSTQVRQSEGSGLDRFPVWTDCVFSWCKNQVLNIRDWYQCSSWFGLHPRKTVGPVSDRIVGHKRTTGEAGHYRCISGIRSGLQWTAIWLPCLEAVWGAIREGFIPKLLS